MVLLLKGKGGDRLFPLCQCLRKLKVRSCPSLNLYQLSYVQIKKQGSESLSNLASIFHLIREEMKLELVPWLSVQCSFFLKWVFRLNWKGYCQISKLCQINTMTFKKLTAGCDIAQMLNGGSKKVNKCQKERWIYSQNFKVVSKISPRPSSSFHK